MPAGYLALVLHAHLPYVHHPEQKEVMEERWLFEALTECYLPLIDILNGLAEDGVNFRITFSLSPTLISMLTSEMLQERYSKHLDNALELALLERERLVKIPEFQHLSDFYLNKLLRARDIYNEYNRNLLLHLKNLQERGYVEVITTCATHGYMPLIKTRAGWRGQVEPALDLYHGHFGRSPAGMWLPECGYVPGLDEILAEYNIKYFFLDWNGILNSRPSPVYGVFAPVRTRKGVAVFGRDPDSSLQVWDRHVGYPGDSFYREFYRDIGYDLDREYLNPFLPGDGIRVATGFKYHRITGTGPQKKPYLPETALEKAAEHAWDFYHRRLAQAEKVSLTMDRKPLVTAPYDAELFGHWWYEGPAWLEFLCREICSENRLRMVTPSDYLREYPENQVVDPPMCSWDAGGYNQYWLNPSTDWIYRHLHRAEEKMSELADLYPHAEGFAKRCLNQAARELLLAQSSDWPFIIHSETAVDYAVRRFKNHIGRFNAIVQMLESGNVDKELLSAMETRSPFLQDIDYRVFMSNTDPAGSQQSKQAYRVLVLTWEYPPLTVGGLARHVHDLSVALAGAGNEVHVITCPVENKGLYSMEQGVHVHRINSARLTAYNFMDWVDQLNDGMEELVTELINNNHEFDLLHAHDWLVGKAATAIASKYGLPLVATIHATEYGRNRGLHNDLQRYIHNLEGELAGNATLIIGCSSYMGREIADLFKQPYDKIKVIPNGVDPENIVTRGPNPPRQCGEEKCIVFLGRLVPEKGVHILISALPDIIKAVGPVRLLVAGKGPYQRELEKISGQTGVADRVKFLGFVDDEGRNRLLNHATVAVFPSLYEPFGIVALEAMAAGVPVVASDTGGLSDVIEHGVDGYLAPPGDARMLAHYVSEIIRNPELARHFTQKARRNLLLKFNWKQIAAATREVYAEAMGRHSGKEKVSTTGVPTIYSTI